MLEPKGADPLGANPLGLFEDLLDLGMSAAAAPAAVSAPAMTGTFMGVLKRTVGYRKLAYGEEEDEVFMQ